MTQEDKAFLDLVLVLRPAWLGGKDISIEEAIRREMRVQLRGEEKK